MVNFIIVTHGEFGAYLVEAAEEIVGRQKEGVRCVGISPRLGVEEVRARVKAAVDELRGKDGLVIFNDMPGGTPCNVSLPLCKDMHNVSVLAGVNLYMLITAFNSRAELPLKELTEKVLSAGRRSIADLKTKYEIVT